MATEYYLKLNISDCNFDIKVNDIPLFKNSDGGSIGTRLGINHLIRYGKNGFSAALLPINIQEGFRITSRCTLQVFAKNTDPNAEDKMLSESKFEYDEKSKIPVQNLANQFVIAVADFEPSPWDKKESLKLDKKLEAGILEKYNLIISLFARNRVSEIMKEATPKNNFLFNRYNMNRTEQLAFIEKYYQDLINDVDWKLAATDQKAWLLREYAGKKLFCFELPNGEPPIHFHNEKQKLDAFIPVYVYHDGKEFVWAL